MTAKKDPIDIADALSADVGYMRTLLSAIGEKTAFYLENRRLLGPYGELLYSCAAELSDLLHITQRYLDKMDGELETASEFLYSIEAAE